MQRLRRRSRPVGSSLAMVGLALGNWNLRWGDRLATPGRVRELGHRRGKKMVHEMRIRNLFGHLIALLGRFLGINRREDHELRPIGFAAGNHFGPLDKVAKVLGHVFARIVPGGSFELVRYSASCFS